MRTVAHNSASVETGPGVGYCRHRPEDTLLYQIVEHYYPLFAALRAEQGRPLPAFVQREFEDYLKCGRLEHGFLRVRCSECHAEKLVAFSCKCRGFCPSCGARRMVDSATLLVDEVLPHVPMRQWVLSVPFPLRFLFASQPAVMSAVLRIVVRAITGQLLTKAGYHRSQAQTGAVTLIQRFGSALNLNIHFHMLFMDGVYRCDPDQRLRFVPVAAPTPTDMARLIEQISQRVARHLERQGWLVRDEDNSYLAWDAEQASALDDVIGHAVTYRIAVGPHCGQKAFTLQTLPTMPPDEDEDSTVARAGGFSLHAGIAAHAGQRARLERLCRYVARPAVATRRLSLTRRGDIRYSLKTPYRDGTTHVIFEPLDFIARLAALVPRPRVNLTRFHGVFAPNSRWRARITPARRGKPSATAHTTEPQKRHAMTWAQRLKRVFRIDIETSEHCGGAVKIIASIEDPLVIAKILEHLRHQDAARDADQAARAPPADSSFRLMD